METSNRKIDLLLIHPGAAHGIYGKLGDDLVAVEPPLWCRLIADYARRTGLEVQIIDAEAERLGPNEVAQQVDRMNPLLVCLCVYGHQPSASTQQMTGAGAIARAITGLGGPAPVMMMGGHVSALPERTLREEAIDFACVGEGPETVVQLVEGLRHGAFDQSKVPGLVWWGDSACVINDPAPLIDPKQLRGDAWDLLPMHLYRAHNWQCFGDLSQRQPYAAIYTTLGCPFKCLAGDTLVNTIYGKFPIKELAECFGDRGVPIYTYDPATRRVFVANGVKIRKYGSDERMVRVRFDDGTHIDCTPDHKFLQFKWGNGKSSGGQWACEAKDLVTGAHVRAIRYEKHSKTGRMYVTWGRRARQFQSRLIMEYLMERPLSRSEHVHHDDLNKSNDHPSNLEFCESALEHSKRHPEIAERMRTNNPTRNGIGPEWRARIGAGSRGKVRSEASRLRYRESKLGERNPNFRHGERTGTKPRIEVNHRVVSVEPLTERGDVYCLTVPETGWFFANDVLVQNCSFCCINAPFGGSGYRTREPRDVVDEILKLKERYGVRTFKIVDEMYVLKDKHYAAICEGLIASGEAHDLNIWAYARVDTVEPTKLDLLRRAGIRWLALGIESGSKHVRDGAKKAMREDDIAGVVRSIQDADINVIANYIVGLPDDTAETMEETYQLAAALNTEFMNVYSAQAYPGSPLYDQAVRGGWSLPATWAGYSQHNEWCRPLDTKFVSGREVLAFRDAFFVRYFSRPEYVEMIRGKFGEGAVSHVQKMLNYKLKRRLLTGEMAA